MVSKATIAAFSASLLLATAGAGAAAAQTRSAENCRGLLNRQIPALQGAALTITKAELLPAGMTDVRSVMGSQSMDLPGRCYVEGMINGRKGVNGVSYGLGFALALPDNWNGRFLQQGGGGANGNLSPPIGPVSPDKKSALARGFAVVSTDGGHKSKGGFFDRDFLVDQQAVADFAFNAVPTVAVVAKAIVADYYARPANKSYFVGCSTGGRESMEAAQRYPFIFDGVVTGAPAMRTGHSGLALNWMSAQFTPLTPKDPKTGKLDINGAFSPADRKLLIGRLLSECDGLDGLKDGMIFNSSACRFDPGVLRCKGAKTDSCLTPKQVTALQTAFGGPKASNGRQIYPGFMYDTGIADLPTSPISMGGILSPPMVLGGPPPSTIDADAEEAKINADALQQLTDTYNWTNLSTYFGRGGKQIIYHGGNDVLFSPLDTIGYYERLQKDNGGPEVTRQSSRLFLVPGMSHCFSGSAALDTFDALTPLVAWVEEGKAPAQLVATGMAFPGRSRPLCPWPEHAHYKGSGDPEQASSFECRR